MARPRLDIRVEKKYGDITVIAPLSKDKDGHLRYKVRCGCGREFSTKPHFIMKGTMCESCRRKRSAEKRKNKWIGKAVGNWQILAHAGRNQNRTQEYYCRCGLCGNISIKTIGDVTRARGNGCVKCEPDYHFQVIGDIAYGFLPDGTEFQIDKDMVKAVSGYHWHLEDSGGYIICGDRDYPNFKLHRFIMNIDDSSVIVDHINRDKTDCRRENLRVVTLQQNAMNKSLQKNSTTGYAGVVFLKDKNRYRSVIGLNDRRIYLLTSPSKVECAQAYNYAAELIFGDYRGHVNDVPEPPDELKSIIEKRCRPYRFESMLATQPCGFFDARKAASGGNR